MSRNHLIVEADGDGFRLRDTGSANGTFVNGNQVSKIEICDGDLVTAGKSVFEVSLISGDHPDGASPSASSYSSDSDDPTSIDSAPIRNLQ